MVLEAEKSTEWKADTAMDEASPKRDEWVAIVALKPILMPESTREG
mgnify:CR=1 FL=1